MLRLLRNPHQPFHQVHVRVLTHFKKLVQQLLLALIDKFHRLAVSPIVRAAKRVRHLPIT